MCNVNALFICLNYIYQATEEIMDTNRNIIVLSVVTAVTQRLARACRSAIIRHLNVGTA